MKRYTSNITKDFCFQWSVSKAIMEFVSNALDEGNAEFDVGDDYISITTPNTKVSHKALLLGLSDKRDDDSKRGQFGCGIPQAMAALLAQGVSISIQNSDVIWYPEFEYSSDWEDEVLVIKEVASSGTNFTVNIEGLDEVDVDEVKQRYLGLQDREVLHSTSIGDIIEGRGDEQGEIYCGDVFVCQNDSFAYSYNFAPKELPLNQDRMAVSEWDLKRLTAKMIAMTEDEEFIKEAIEKGTYDTSLVGDSFYTNTYDKTQPHVAVESIGEEFVKEHPEHFVTAYYSDHQENERLGNPSVYIPNVQKVASIQKSEAYQKSIANIEEKERLTPYEELDKAFDELKESVSDAFSEDFQKVVEMFDKLLDLADNWENS